MPINTKHYQYEQRAPQWIKIRDAIAGEDDVKAKRTTYLPALSSQTETPEGAKLYESYLRRASFIGAVGRTKEGICGAITRKPPTIDGVPSSMASLTDAIGTRRESISEVASQALAEVMVGRCAVMVDKEPDDAAQPYIAVFRAEQVINWAEREIDGRLVVVDITVEVVEDVPDPKDLTGLAKTQEPKWIRLRLGTADQIPTDEAIPSSDAPIYWQEHWRKAKDQEVGSVDGFILERVAIPTKRGLRPWTEIPCAIVNAVSGITPTCETPVMLALANVVFAHYLNSADREWGMHLTAIPQPWVTGFDIEEGDRLVIGSGVAWISKIPEAKVGYLEFSGQGLATIAAAMQEKEKQMAVLGSRLLEAQPTQAETMGAVRIRQSGDRSIVANIAANVSEAMTMALRWALSWDSADPASGSATFTLAADFDAMPVDPTHLQALMTALQSGAMSWETFAWNLRRGEVIPPGVTDEDERKRIDAGAPGRSRTTELQLLQADVQNGRITQATYLERCVAFGLLPPDLDVEAEVELTATGPEPEPDPSTPAPDDAPVDAPGAEGDDPEDDDAA